MGKRHSYLKGDPIRCVLAHHYVRANENKQRSGILNGLFYDVRSRPVKRHSTRLHIKFKSYTCNASQTTRSQKLISKVCVSLTMGEKYRRSRKHESPNHRRVNFALRVDDRYQTPLLQEVS